MTRRSGAGIPGLLLGLGALALLTACGQAVDTPAGGESSASASESVSAEPSESATSSDGLTLATEMALEPGRSGRGVPDGVTESMDSPAGVAWSPVAGLVYVVTYGSSSCPTLAEAEAEATADDGGVTVTLLPPSGTEMCTADYAPTTTVVGVPDGTDESVPLTVTLGTHGTVELQPRATDGQPGEVAWAGVE